MEEGREPARIPLRCPNGTHGDVTADGRYLTVRCRCKQCGGRGGARVWHRFDLATGELAATIDDRGERGPEVGGHGIR